LGTPELTISLNLGAMLGALQRSIQRTLDLVSFGLQAAEKAKDIDRLLLPEIKMHFSIAENKKLDVESARKEFRQWVISSGLRDCVEAVNPLMEEARKVCALYLLAEKKRIKNGDLQQKVFGPIRKYHRAGLPDKLKILREEYDPILIPELSDHVMSINTARNCLVHRRGIVAEQDLNTPDALMVRWKRKEILVRDDEGNEKVIELPYLTEKNVTVCLRFVETGRIFKLGEAINFSTEEFSDLCMTFFFFGQQMVTNLQKYGETKGMTFRQSE
jgi:hypothetical protein